MSEQSTFKGPMDEARAGYISAYLGVLGVEGFNLAAKISNEVGLHPAAITVLTIAALGAGAFGLWGISRVNNAAGLTEPEATLRYRTYSEQRGIESGLLYAQDLYPKISALVAANMVLLDSFTSTRHAGNPEQAAVLGSLCLVTALASIYLPVANFNKVMPAYWNTMQFNRWDLSTRQGRIRRRRESNRRRFKRNRI